jgi:hypothetical protein
MQFITNIESPQMFRWEIPLPLASKNKSFVAMNSLNLFKASPKLSTKEIVVSS